MSQFTKQSDWSETPPSSPGLSGLSGSPGAWQVSQWCILSARILLTKSYIFFSSFKQRNPSTSDAAPASPPKTRPKLKLAPRSKPLDNSDNNSSSNNSAIFGSARSREEVLKDKGVSIAAMEEKVNKKAQVMKLTKDQEEEAEASITECVSSTSRKYTGERSTCCCFRA